jgi:hypothetical protein
MMASQNRFTSSDFPSASRTVTARALRAWSSDVHETSHTPALKLTWKESPICGGIKAVADAKTCVSVIRRPEVSANDAGCTLAQPVIPTTAKPAINDDSFMAIEAAESGTSARSRREPRQRNDL